MNGARIGRRVFINTVSIADHNLLEIGDDVVIGADVHISGHTVEGGLLKTALVRLGSEVTIGLGSVIDIDVEIGRGSQIGALTFVAKHSRLEGHATYVGIPARHIREPLSMTPRKCSAAGRRLRLHAGQTGTAGALQLRDRLLLLTRTSAPGCAALAALLMVVMAPAISSAQVTHSLPIRGHDQVLRLYGPPNGFPVIVSSGDGGWIHLGPHVAEMLAARGFFVVGFDVRAYLTSFTNDTQVLRPSDEPATTRLWRPSRQQQRAQAGAHRRV
jgi:hypothetical protein